MRNLLLLFLLNLLFLLGSAQNITIDPEVICPGETAALTTDTTQNVHIGDIICVDNNTRDTLIVSPAQWEALSATHTHTPVSVVFFVDESGEHGWAVGGEIRATTFYDDYENLPITNFITTSLDAYQNMDGLSNTEAIRLALDFSSELYPAFPSDPFYLPSLGQLSIFYAQQFIVLQSLNLAGLSDLDLSDLSTEPWWSSTIGWSSEIDWDDSWCLDNGVGFEQYDYAFEYFSIPVMNF